MLVSVSDGLPVRETTSASSSNVHNASCSPASARGSPSTGASGGKRTEGTEQDDCRGPTLTIAAFLASCEAEFRHRCNNLLSIERECSSERRRGPRHNPRKHLENRLEI